MLRQRNKWLIERLLTSRSKKTNEAGAPKGASDIQFGKAQIAGFAMILLIILLDQVTKWMAMSSWVRELRDGGVPYYVQSFWEWLKDPALPPPAQIYVTDYFNLSVVWNKGVSFGLFSHNDPIMVYILIGTAALISGLLFVWLLQTGRMFMTLSFGAIIGGALANIVDRIRYGSVFDFIDLHYKGYHWPSFNVADMAISVFVFVLIIDSLFNQESALEKAGTEKSTETTKNFVKSHKVTSAPAEKSGKEE